MYPLAWPRRSVFLLVAVVPIEKLSSNQILRISAWVFLTFFPGSLAWQAVYTSFVYYLCVSLSHRHCRLVTVGSLSYPVPTGFPGVRFPYRPSQSSTPADTDYSLYRRQTSQHRKPAGTCHEDTSVQVAPFREQRRSTASCRTESTVRCPQCALLCCSHGQLQKEQEEPHPANECSTYSRPLTIGPSRCHNWRTPS